MRLLYVIERSYDVIFLPVHLEYICIHTACPLDLIEQSRLLEVLIFWTQVEREGRGEGEERKREHGLNLARLETASELKKLLTLNL